MGRSSEPGPGCPTCRSLADSACPVAPWPPPGGSVWGRGREGSHRRRNWGFLVLQSPHSALWSPRPCLAWWSPQIGWRGANPPVLQNELAAAAWALSDSPGDVECMLSLSQEGTVALGVQRGGPCPLQKATISLLSQGSGPRWAPGGKGFSWSLNSAWEGEEALALSSLTSLYSCRDPVAS